MTAPKTLSIKTLQLRNDTKENWTSKNPVLAKGEMGVEIDTNKFKFGDGIKTWSDLPYNGVVVNQSSTNGNITIDGTDVTVYSLPAATDSVLGGVKVGSHLSISNGVLSATYTANNGVTLSGNNFVNSGVRAIETGSSNGTVSVNTNGTTTDVAVKGLGSNAFTSTAYAPLNSPALTGTPTAPTPNAGTNSTQVATTAFVESEIASKIGASQAMIYKGTIGTGGTVTTLPNTTALTGWTYKVITAGTYANQKCEIGDMIIALTDGSSSANATWTVVQNNIDGAVTGPSSSTADHIPAFNNATGKVIKDSGILTSNLVLDTDTITIDCGNA